MNQEWTIGRIMVTDGIDLGKRFHDSKSGKRSIRVSIVGALCQGQLIAPLTFDGSRNIV